MSRRWLPYAAAALLVSGGAFWLLTAEAAPPESAGSEKAAPPIEKESPKPAEAKPTATATEVAKPQPAAASPARPAPTKAAPAPAVEAKKPAASASTTDLEPQASPDELAIRLNVHKYVVAYEQQDAKALAALWAPEAEYVNGETGERLQGRAAIEALFTARFAAAAPSRLLVKITSIHFATKDVAIEDGVATVTHEDAEPETTSYTAVHVKQGNHWLIDSIRETELPAPATAQDHLGQLDWLAGEWIDDSDEAVIYTKYYWSPNRAFMVHTFTAFVGEELNLQGTQIIGWDPVQQKIRSWAFDSDGGFAESIWEPEGDRIVIRQKSTLADGGQGSAINIITKLNDDQITWKSTARQIDGEMQPSVDEILIVRRPALDADADAEVQVNVESLEEEEPSQPTEQE